MDLEEFNYDLPENLIAQIPLRNRAGSKLLVANSKRIIHAKFQDLDHFVNKGDLIVLNDTKVINARIYAKRITGRDVEIMLERVMSPLIALARLGNAKNISEGENLHIDHKQSIKVIERNGNIFTLEFDTNISEILNEYGSVPLPPYITRKPDLNDSSRYQTVYAKEEGAIAAPTAGLHFDKPMIEKIKNNGIDIEFLTLHVGFGTFTPIKTQNISDHRMHEEYVHVSEHLCNKIIETKKRGGRVIAVGTTTTRALESCHQGKDLEPKKGYTNLYICPGFKFNVVDVMITNFHQPKSSLMVMIAAFIGTETVKKIYQSAINNRYRFLSYGDVTLLERS